MNKRMSNLKHLIADRRSKSQSSVGARVADPVALQTMGVLFGDARPAKEEPVEEISTENPVAESPVEESYEEESIEEIIEDEIASVAEEQASVEEPVEEAPLEEPVEEAPVEELVEETPVEEPVEEAPIEEPVEETPVEEPVEETPDEQSTESATEVVPDVYGSPIAVESHVEGTASFGGTPDGENSDVMPFEFGKPKRRNRRKNKEVTNG